MRLSTRFGLVALLAVLPLLGGLGYAIGQLRALAETNERLATRQLAGVRVASEVSARLPRLEEFQRKFAVSADPGYAEKYRQTARVIGSVLEELAQVRTSAAESRSTAALATSWKRLDVESGPLPEGARADALTQAFEDLRGLAADVREETDHAVRTELHDARLARRRAQQVATWVSALAVIVSVTLLAWAVRTLRTRLEEFTEATAAVSEGQFSYRMPAGGTDELARVAMSFNRMVGALKQLDRMKEDFVSSISHELRTPIVAMQETNNLLLDELPGPLTAKQRRMLELNSNAATRLSTMIGDLLDLGRVKAGIRYRMGRHEVSVLTRTAAQALEARAMEREVVLHVTCDGDLFAVCDPDRYVQVVQNLVDNALKHAPAGGHVEVTLRCVPRRVVAESCGSKVSDGPHVLLTVADDGPGIPESDRDRVFDKFFRRQGQPADAGVGLGLAICREIVAAHEGAIWVDGPSGAGATLRVALPCAPAGMRSGE